ncbi:MAG: 3-methyl-2-oxobutanoate dehydrogenase subunit VorB [Spirochaetales bacterium]|uniref:3-methyl-2-oxobutanoate dehydrogenase subunit VorB n=1 Tax=Candidatus Thalassospirochaeta sargassi TaxID=3119039 RepID=A0AAJ1IJ89_9SPIO|nr:3-methyl-2-oxobutanoate dehydrogenase subunit VorB [Spirochaetales bacterium]
MTKTLIKGNHAIVRGALLGGATHFFGYPITPASEIAHGAADLFTRSGRTFLQAESETSAINMIYGAAAAGARVMTASSGPGVSLMLEGISYLAGSELPAVIVDVQRAGPGLGNIWPEQTDYNMCCKGGGHGAFRNIVLAPASGQEMTDFAYKAFDLADKWRMTVIILSDAYIGQMMEPVGFPSEVKHGQRKDWAVYGDAESRENLLTSIIMNQKGLSEFNEKLQAKYRRVEAEIVDWEEIQTEDSDYLLVAFGITSRIAATAVRMLREEGIKVGLFRPRTLWPFPSARLAELGESVKSIGVAELNDGMMADDVDLAVKGKCPVDRFNWFGGYVPSAEELVEKVKEAFNG